jgi:hypothetical protein
MGRGIQDFAFGTADLFYHRNYACNLGWIPASETAPQ